MYVLIKLFSGSFSGERAKRYVHIYIYIERSFIRTNKYKSLFSSSHGVLHGNHTFSTCLLDKLEWAVHSFIIYICEPTRLSLFVDLYNTIHYGHKKFEVIR